MLRITLAVLHLLALGMGLGAVFVRARSANRLKQSAASLRALFASDGMWGAAAILWISTGLWRAFAGTEKAPSYYWSNHVFMAKMGFLVLVLLLEVWPMLTLIRWRAASRHGAVDSTELALKGRMIARISDVQLLLVICMVVAAVMLARGYGAR